MNAAIVLAYLIAMVWIGRLTTWWLALALAPLIAALLWYEVRDITRAGRRDS